MLRNITIGQYIPGGSLLHRLDPRTKILLSLVIVVSLFFAHQARGYILLGALILALVAISGVPFGYVLRGLRPLTFIIALTFLLHLFMDPGNTIFRLGPLTATDRGFAEGVFTATRLALLVVTTSLVTLTTSPIALTDGLERLLTPLAVVGVPAHELAMMTTIALRFIPTLLEETEKIMKAQMARGADFESGNIARRAKAMIPILVPLFVSAFRRADELAMAMEARCYRGGKGRTHLRQLKLTPLDAAAFTLITVYTVTTVVFF
ncbi:MAG: energy-coupling factor transporter transmembrane protein EcfT [Firmicutes bacterium]|nr:energy-coupling factor transporter transmembrane protein EcfT [Bacillota bacterium]